MLDSSVTVSQLSDEELQRLSSEARELDDLWEADPAEPFRDMPAVAALFSPLIERRDKLVARLRELELELARRRGPGPRPQTSALLSQYLVDVQRRGGMPTFGNSTSWAATESPEDAITLHDLWTPLRVDDALHRSGNPGTHESMAEGDLGTDLLQLVDASEDSLVILGEPGGGKSTCVAMLATLVAQR